MEVSGGKKSRRICLDISPLFFHVVPRLLQALFITYDEISQALAVGDVLLPKSFQVLSFGGVVRWQSSATDVFLQFPKHVKIRGRLFASSVHLKKKKAGTLAFRLTSYNVIK
jgi:hypothetical protein